MSELENFDLNFFTRRAPVNITSNIILFHFDPGDPALADARIWLERELWGRITKLNPKAQLKILEMEEGKDLREEYEEARLAIFPLRLPLLKSARPLLQTLAMQLPMVITSTVLQCPVVRQELPGLKLGDQFVRADTAESFAALSARLLEIRGPGLHLAQKGRKYVEALLGRASDF